MTANHEVGITSCRSGSMSNRRRRHGAAGSDRGATVRFGKRVRRGPWVAAVALRVGCALVAWRAPGMWLHALCGSTFQQQQGPSVTVNSYRLRATWNAGLNSANQAETKRFQYRLMLVDAAQLVGGIVHMQNCSALTDSEDVADLPSGLAFHRPAQAFELAWRERGHVGLR